MVEGLDRAFALDPSSGTLVRVASKQRPDLVGRPAGYLDNHGYYRVSFAGRKYLRSHVVFALTHGRWPTGEVDHINRVRTDDRPDNLREASHHENMWNRTPVARSLPMGVVGRHGSFTARMMWRGQRLHLGRFPTAEAASEAYQNKRKELCGEYC